MPLGLQLSHTKGRGRLQIDVRSPPKLNTSKFRAFSFDNLHSVDATIEARLLMASKTFRYCNPIFHVFLSLCVCTYCSEEKRDFHPQKSALDRLEAYLPVLLLIKFKLSSEATAGGLLGIGKIV
jgi:hypothetical protein